MTDLWNDLLGCLGLAPCGPGAYEGRSQQLEYRRLFGGQLLAQFACAAQLAAPGKGLKSLHTQFLREGHPDEPVRYETDLPQEGRTFAAVRLTARQEHGVIAMANASLHAWEEGPDRQTTHPVPAPPEPEHVVELGLLPWESRATADLDTTRSEPPGYELWTRIPQAPHPVAPALLAYATDLTLIGTALRPVEGLTQRDAPRAFTSAVTSHTVWFHRPFTTGDWVLLRQHSPLAAHARCFGHGEVLAPGGELLASYAQEALLRFTA
ncbi:thioesterase family protein [Streptomyces sp. ID05-04B]|uniref:acyl-CoA thioesterase n=1 Tax=unclassified Streptomyces TaxID=2593676 RepID=UPI000D1A931A|nr:MULTISPECIES: acyl-CoA thioesterase domain-containing protein [unclassified Streptomyces]AVV45677.1 acyl-CoA thioesterase II [Streptomyces sp. P3]MDX5565862.1 thioesterase family protein [Streptomyces sp. ID05-04B]